jgi:hypothetical protein
MCFFVALVSAILLIRQFGHFQKGRAAGVKLSGSCRPDSLDHIPAPSGQTASHKNQSSRWAVRRENRQGSTA